MTERYTSFTVTSAGENIITRIIAGLSVTFKRIAIGDGFDYDTDNFIAKERLTNEVKSLDIKTIQITDSANVELAAEFGTGDIEDSFYFRELGIYIVDPDNKENEILFAYGNRNDAAEYITPHIQNYKVLKNIKCEVRVGSSANVNIQVNRYQITLNLAYNPEIETLRFFYEENGVQSDGTIFSKNLIFEEIEI